MPKSDISDTAAKQKSAKPQVVTPVRQHLDFLSLRESTDYTMVRTKKGTAKGDVTASVGDDPQMNVPADEPSSDDEGFVIDGQLEPDFASLLERLIDVINLAAKKRHEILIALATHGTISWQGFIIMGDDDIRKLTYSNRKRATIPLSSTSIRSLLHLKHLAMNNLENGVDGSLIPSTYTRKMYMDSVVKFQLDQRKNIYQATNSSNLPVVSSVNSKSPGEKKYEAWNRGRGSRSKSSFEVLTEDKKHPMWKIKFEAELYHQKLEHIVDPKTDPSAMTDSFEKELWKEQIIYFWTVLLYVFKNPLGKSCINDHLRDRDSRAAYIAHEALQSASPAKIYNTSDYYAKLSKLSIATYTGTRTAFITEWFQWFTMLNDNSSTGNKMGFDFARSQLLQAIQDDDDLPDSFTEFKITGDNDTDLATLQAHLLHKATLYDGKDDFLKRGAKRSLVAKAHIRQLSDIYGKDDPDAIHDIQEFASYRTTRGSDPRARLPDHLFTTLAGNDKSAWRNAPDSLKLKLVEFINGKSSQSTHQTTRHQPNGNSTNRQTYFHQFIPEHDMSTVTDDFTFQQRPSILANTARSSASTADTSGSSGTPPPPSNSTEASGTPTKQASVSFVTDKPLLSTLDPAHPAAIMSKPKVPLYDSNGTYQGYLNNFHRWITHGDDATTCASNATVTSDMTYHVSKRKISKTNSISLVDRGANGFVGGSDCVLIGHPSSPRSVSITGIDNHQMVNIPIATVGAHVMSNRGPVICIFNEVAYTGNHQSILSAIQMEHYGITVDDKSKAAGGQARLSTPDGYLFPLSISGGLPYMHMRPYTDDEYSSLPHVIMTSPQVWDPRIFDDIIDPNEATTILPEQLHKLPHQDYDVRGEYVLSSIRSSNQSLLTFGSNGNAEFTQFVQLPELDNQDDIVDPTASPATVDFWLHEAEYCHNEAIARCVYVAQLDQPEHLFDGTQSATDRHAHSPRIHTPSKRDYGSMQRFFAWLPTKMIQETFKNSTQYGFQPVSPDGNLFKRWQSPNPAMNIFRLNDDLLTDKIHADTPAIEGGHTEAQVFFGRKCHIIHVEPISKIRKFIHCLQDFVRKWGAPNRLLGDHAANQSSFKVMDYLRLLWIGFWCSEPYYQHQNMFERRYQTFKRVTNRLMDRTGTPPHLWFLCLCYVAYVMNRVSDPSLNHRQPHLVATGRVADISAILSFQWMEPIYYKLDDSAFPSESGEALGYWVGIAEHVGHSMTYCIWNKKTGTILHRSAIRTALDATKQNKRANAILEDDETHQNGEQSPDRFSTHPPSGRTSSAQDYGELISGRPPDLIYSEQDIHLTDADESPIYGEHEYLSDIPPTDLTTVQTDTKAPIFVVLNDEDGNPKLDPKGNPMIIKGIDHKELQGRTFLRRQDDGETLRARIVERIKDKRESNKDLSEFKIKYDKSDVEDIIAYNDIMNFIHHDQINDPNHIWKYKQILGHQGPLTHRDYHYKGSRYNVEIEWENGEITYEPLSVILEDSPVFLAEYAAKHSLLDVEGWKRLKPIARRSKKLHRLVNQARLRSFRTAPKYMYGFQVPRDYRDAVDLDRHNGNTRWTDAISLEMKQLNEYDTFIDKGVYSPGRIPTDFKRIRVHLVFAVKHDGRHKARMCAEGNLTDIPLNSVYAGVVSLRGLRMCIFLAELNGMEAYATDIGNAYLEAVTQEKVCIKAGPEFGDREGHLLIIHKALYGLRSSGREFGDLLASCLKELGFTPSKAESEIFMREKNGIYEYVATYVDDLCLVMKNPESFLKQLQSPPYSFKLKGSGPMEFHLGCGFQRDADGVLCMHPRKYVDKMIAGYEQMFGRKPSTKARSPIEENDHPELDTSEFLDDDYTNKYQTMIGSLQWIIAIGRWDIQTAVMTLSSFRAQPRRGHLERAQRIYGYIAKFKDYCVRFRTEEPDLSALNNKLDLDWSRTVYGEHAEDRPNDAPKPLGKRVTLVHYFDANLMHDVLSGKAVTGCIHLANKTPIMWYSKKQATTETATYGAEFISGRTCIEQIIDLRNTFRYLGVPIHDTSYVFGDNETMINSASIPGARLQKRHNILSYHYVRSMISRGFIALHHLRSHNNLSDVLTKHWSYNSVRHLLQPAFHYVGNTANLYIDDTPGCLDTKIIRTSNDLVSSPQTSSHTFG
jgi:hypothetical protein